MEAQTLLTQLAIDPTAQPEFSPVGGELRRNGKLYIGSTGELRRQVFDNLHGGPEGGHSGILATTKRIASLFWWPKMGLDISNWVQSCDICQRFKGEHVNYPGLLQPISVPDQAWETVTMDFVEGLPKASGKDTILVVIDKYTKYCHLMALQHLFTASQVAQNSLIRLLNCMGLPKS